MAFRITAIGAAAALALAAGAAGAAPLTDLEDGFTIVASPTSVSVTGSTLGGYGPAENMIDGDLSTGFPNISSGNTLTFTFGAPVFNGPGADLLVVDGRYDSSAIDVSFDGGATYSRYEAGDFYNTGVMDALTADGGGAFPYTAYALLIDLSNHGFAAGGSLTSFSIKGVSGTGFDSIDVASISSATGVIPVPAALPLLATGLVALGALRRKRRA
jgi:hypothetical protein